MTDKLSPVEQLEIIREQCEQIERQSPKRRASYDFSFTSFDKSLRDGVVFYSSGWGWRLRKDWRETWQAKWDEAVADIGPALIDGFLEDVEDEP